MSKARRYWQNRDARRDSLHAKMEAEDAVRDWKEKKDPSGFPKLRRCIDNYSLRLTDREVGMTAVDYDAFRAAYEASLT